MVEAWGIVRVMSPPLASMRYRNPITLLRVVEVVTFVQDSTIPAGRPVVVIRAGEAMVLDGAAFSDNPKFFTCNCVGPGMLTT